MKKGEGVDTTYMVNPLPHKQLDPSIKKAFMEKRCNLDALYDGDDPFASGWESYTEGVFDKPADVVPLPKEATEKLSSSQSEELIEILSDCDPAYQEKVWGALKIPKGSSLANLTPDLYKRVKAGALQNRAKFLMHEVEEQPV